MSTTETRLDLGNVAPPFTLIDDSGQVVSLSHFSGQNVVLFFYPRDNTSG